ncbi:MAG TPA: hypothetical protein VJT31_13675 [Rugosimonospora sp.]|nr:hypothetical protein [Rugosimonospora sp.]
MSEPGFQTDPEPAGSSHEDALDYFRRGTAATTPPVPATRPRQATLLAVLLAVFGGLGICAGYLLLSIVNDSASHGQSVPAVLYVLVYGQFALAAAEAVCGVFVWQGRAWARTAGNVLCSVNIVGAVLSLFAGAIPQAIAGIAINIGLLRLLNNEDVRDWCSR